MTDNFSHDKLTLLLDFLLFAVAPPLDASFKTSCVFLRSILSNPRTNRKKWLRLGIALPIKPLKPSNDPVERLDSLKTEIFSAPSYK